MPFRPCPSGCGRFLSADDGHDRCLQCLGRRHAEAAFVDDSCVCCGRMSMISLRSRLSFMKGLAPSAATSRGSPADALGHLRVTVRASPPGTPPRTSYTSRSEHPVRFPGDFAGLSHGAPSISFGATSVDRIGSQPRPAPVPFFPEVHEELTSSWMAPFTARSRSSASSVLTTLDGGVARGYATWRNRPRLPSKACKLTAALAAKAYSAAGQAASALHAMAILQVHQAKALKQVHEGSTDPGLMQELRTATEFALRATKVTARSLGKAMSTMVVQERHLWLNLAEMKDVDKARFLDAPISQGGLFGDTVEGFAQQFSAVQQQTEAIQHILPRRDAPSTAAPGARPQSSPPSVPSTPTPFRCTTTGMSIVPLEPLAQRLEAWLTLPSLSRWLTRTIRLGYAIQFARRPPKFNGVLETSVAVRNAPVLREEIAVLLAKDAIEPVPPAEMRQGFYSPYFIVPKKGGGLRPILDLRVLNRALHKLPFKMLTHRRMIKCIQPQDWFAAIDLKDAYFHVSILPRHRPFYSLRSKVGHGSTGSSPSGSPCLPVCSRRL